LRYAGILEDMFHGSGLSGTQGKVSEMVVTVAVKAVVEPVEALVELFGGHVFFQEWLPCQLSGRKVGSGKRIKTGV
jgi:hypothetical protein